MGIVAARRTRHLWNLDGTRRQPDMWEDQRIQQAILAARAGRELTARDMFLDIVRDQPHNETAWLWLIGLLDDPEDCIEACERALMINPGRAPVRERLNQLLAEREQRLAEERARAEEQARTARKAMKPDDRESALMLARHLTASQHAGPEAWRFLSEASTDINEQIGALKKLLEFEPGNARVKNKVRQLNHFIEDPFDLASFYTERGEREKAIAAYQTAAMDPRFKKRWNEIYWKMASLQRQREEQIAHIPPLVSIARLTFAPTLLYVALTLVHVGVNPFANPQPLLWSGFFVVLLGGFMNALAVVRSHNKIWAVLFRTAAAHSTPAMRFIMATGGWILIALPHILLFLLAVMRIKNAGSGLEIGL